MSNRQKNVRVVCLDTHVEHSHPSIVDAATFHGIQLGAFLKARLCRNKNGATHYVELDDCDGYVIATEGTERSYYLTDLNTGHTVGVFSLQGALRILFGKPPNLHYNEHWRSTGHVRINNLTIRRAGCHGEPIEVHKQNSLGTWVAKRRGEDPVEAASLKALGELVGTSVSAISRAQKNKGRSNGYAINFVPTTINLADHTDRLTQGN